ncbi:MAG: hypothetical protein KDC38_20675, partial [Planctomycetes bacterium]|nr:hypothetical protein [Planctomycetota bacterium]
MLRYAKPRKLKRHDALTRYYYVRVFDPADGKRRDVSTGCTSKRAAEEWVRAREIEQQTLEVARANKIPHSKQDDEPECPTFRDAVECWKTSLAGCSSSHLRVTGSRSAYWVAYFGDTRLDRIRVEDFEKYRQLRLKGKIRASDERDPVPISNTSANSDLRALRALFAYAVSREWIAHNRAKRVSMLKGVRRARVFQLSTVDEVELLRCCRDGSTKNVRGKRNATGRQGGSRRADGVREWKQTVPTPDHLHPFVVCALYSGLRRGTLLSLTWRDIDLKERRWRIPAEKMKAAEDYH